VGLPDVMMTGVAMKAVTKTAVLLHMSLMARGVIIEDTLSCPALVANRLHRIPEERAVLTSLFIASKMLSINFVELTVILEGDK
jgi:hypothetical protein